MTEVTESAGTSGGFAIGPILAIWRRRQRLALMIGGPLLAATITLALSLPTMHRATATLLLEQAGAEGPGRPTAADLEARLFTITEEVLSRARLEALMDRFDLYRELRSRGDRRGAIDRLRSDIQVKFKGSELGPGRGATVAFSVNVRGRDAETVARVANALATVYRDESLRLRERGRLIRLRQELARMQQVYRDQYPDVIRLKADIAATERQLTDRFGKRATNSLLRFDATAQAEPEQDLARGEEFRLLDPAIPGGRGAAPNRAYVFLLGILATLGATGGIVLLADRLDASLHGVDELGAVTNIAALSRVLNLVGVGPVAPWRPWSAVALSVAGLGLVVWASYYVARGNEQLVWILSRAGG